MRTAGFSRLLLFAAVCTACKGSDGSTGLSTGTPGLSIVAGAGTADTIGAEPAQALLVEVRNTAGAVVRGVAVQFAGVNSGAPQQPGANMIACRVTASFCVGTFNAASDTTDANGRARVRVKFGDVAGTAIIRITVPSLSLSDSATYTVRPGAPAAIVPPAPDTAILVGETIRLAATVSDRRGNALQESLPFITSPGAVVVSDSVRATVRAVAFGEQLLQYRADRLRDSMLVKALPDARIVVWSTIDDLLTLLDLTGRNARVILRNAGSSTGAFPRFGPSRQRITFHRSSASSLDNANVVGVLDTTAGRTPNELFQSGGFTSVLTTRTLRDGSVLVVGRRTGDPTGFTAGDGYAVFRMTPDFSITRVSNLPTLTSITGGVDVSSDGARVAYTSPVPLGRSEIRVLTVATGTSVSITPDGAFGPRWSPDDSRIAYLSLTPDFAPTSVGTLQVVNADGTARSTVSGNGYLAGCTWSPDATYLLCRESSPRVGLRVLRVSDGLSVPLRFGRRDLRDSYVQPDWR